MISSILTICVLSFGAFDNIDTIPKKLYIGYDQGISLRYFPHTNFGCGLIVQQPGTNLYDRSERDYRSDNNYSIQERQDKSKGKGIQLIADGYYRKKIGTTFWITPYISLGGNYSSSKDSYSGDQTIKDSTAEHFHYENTNERTTKAFIGQIGVMPGIQFGRFQIEFRLGLKGSVYKTMSPDDSKGIDDSNTKQVRLTYPSDFVRSIIIHLGF